MTLFLIAVAVLPLGQCMVRPLEARLPAPAMRARVDGIILLDGGEAALILTAAGVLQSCYRLRGRIDTIFPAP